MDKTMDDVYGDGSDHICCDVCGQCKTCGCACSPDFRVMSARDARLMEVYRKFTSTVTTNVVTEYYTTKNYPEWVYPNAGH